MSSKNKHFSHVDHKKTDEIPMCYWCNKSGHIKAECPEAKKDKHKNHKKEFHKKKNKAMVATWSDEDQSLDSNEESSCLEGNVICFMAGSSEEQGAGTFPEEEEKSGKNLLRSEVEQRSAAKEKKKKGKRGGVWSRSALGWSRSALVLEPSCSSVCELLNSQPVCGVGQRAYLLGVFESSDSKRLESSCSKLYALVLVDPHNSFTQLQWHATNGKLCKKLWQDLHKPCKT
ncbi:hypothetical protein Taro_029375 [Colocasia esculenta]|uniref:CCHC-type domain-containing protein n=1 Tax=Colocasia esculenta TaxID=4460 RepID=A0A843VX05_COLES|nr:hypothetical protein [Colocasia esculenta]